MAVAETHQIYASMLCGGIPDRPRFFSLKPKHGKSIHGMSLFFSSFLKK
jgi:hypothetical protein